MRSILVSGRETRSDVHVDLGARIDSVILVLESVIVSLDNLHLTQVFFFGSDLRIELISDNLHGHALLIGVQIVSLSAKEQVSR